MSPKRLPIVVLCLALPLTLAPAGLVGADLPRAAAPAQGVAPPPPHLLYDGLLDVPRLPLARDEPAAALDASAAVLTPEYAAWSRLVFQSARNGHDWDIFAARGDGSEQVNLSNHGAMDMHPRLNRGATRVAFASNRDGNYELYVMNADGSGQAKVTYSGKDDVYPAWSPDGSRIAFQAYRDGQAEIYVMSANGTGPTRLTNYGDYDGQPAWSPDGAKIAFVRRLDGKYRIWAMNADGSNARQLSNQASSENPAWSPDGSQIAYDADGNGDGWQELWLMDATGGNQRQAYQPGESNTDAWACSWSPDGRYVAFTRISFVQQGSDWYWTSAYLDAWDMQNPGNTIRLSNNGEDWHPDLETADIWAPASSIEPLPTQLAWTFTVQWTGTDTGPSGIASFDVQVRDGSGGTWADWKMATLATTASYSGVGGHTYYFRARARDNAGNVEAWPADYDAFTTLEIDLLAPTSSIEPLSTQSPGIFLVRWSGSDAGPSGMANFDVQVKDGASGAWTNWRMATTDHWASYAGIGGHTYYFRARARDNAGNLEMWPADYDAFTSVESMPPISAVRPLPAFTRGQKVEVQWSGSDPGGSDIRYYDVQVQDATEGNWTDWRTNTTSTSATFTGAPGHTYRFRARGVDLAENVEPWPAGDGDTQTAFYLWVIHGWVRDSSGTPVQGAAITTSPAAISTAMSESDGAYMVHAGASTATYTASVAKDGYGNLPPTTFSSAEDAQLDLVLPPADNVVRNGDFESSLQPDWQTSGAFTAVVTRTLRHTGNQAARLGESDLAFTPPINLTNSTTDDGGWLQMAPDGGGGVHLFWYQGNPGQLAPALYAWRAYDGTWLVQPEAIPSRSGNFWYEMAGGPDGTVHVVGWQHIDGRSDLTYTMRPPGSAWSAARPLTANMANIGLEGQPKIAVGSNNIIHVVWHNHNNSQIYWTMRNASGTWTEPRGISGQSLRGGPREWQLVIDPSGTAHVVWTDGGTLDRYTCRPAAGDWLTPKTLRDAWLVGDMQHAGLGSLAVGVDGRVHVVWHDYSDADIFYAQGSCQGAWSVPETVGSGGYPLLAVDPIGTIHLLTFSRFFPIQQLQYYRRPNGGSWSAPQALEGVPSYTPPNLATDDNGTAHVLWSGRITEGTSEPFQLYYTHRSDDPTWSPPMNVSGAAQRLSVDNDWHVLAVESNGRVHAGWFDGPNDIKDLYYATSVSIQQADDAMLSQEITVPAAPAHPGLSFLYRLGDVSNSGGNSFSVEVRSETDTRTLLSTDADTRNWTHRWFDLQSWAGQTVTLTFTLHQASGQKSAWAYIDEVTVGSTYPDSWVHQSSRSAALPGQQVVQTITFGNRGAVAASNARVTLQLPPELTFVSADPTPSAAAPALRWDVGDLAAGDGPQVILVTLQVAPSAAVGATLITTANIASDTSEPEQANNTAQGTTFVGHRAYLPASGRR